MAAAASKPHMIYTNFTDWNWWMSLSMLLGIFVSVVYFLAPRRAARSAEPQRSQSARASSESPQEAVSIGGTAAMLGVEIDRVTGGAPLAETTQPLAALAAGSAEPRRRVDYLDNLKVFLTFNVIVHHATCVFGGVYEALYVAVAVCPQSTPVVKDCTESASDLFMFWGFQLWFLRMNQAYFMALFFFISGFFTPRSLDKKGRHAFLADKMKRLGIPVLAWFFVLGPLLKFVCTTLLFPGKMEFYTATGTWYESGPPWFILWLTIFNMVYAFAHWHLFPDVFVMFMPGGLRFLLMYVAFFAAGILAQRNAWLDQLEQMNLHAVWLLRGLTLLLALTTLLYVVLSRYSDANGVYDSMQDVLWGVFAIAASISEVQFFQQHCSIKRRILADGAYGVYLVHPFVLCGAAWSYIRILKGLGKPVAYASSYPWYWAVGDTEGEGVLWMGWAYTCVVTVVLSWLLATLLKRVPVVRDIL